VIELAAIVFSHYSTRVVTWTRRGKPHPLYEFTEMTFSNLKQDSDPVRSKARVFIATIRIVVRVFFFRSKLILPGG
jgi:hypothetical protein